jgi:O-antigen ligase
MQSVQAGGAESRLANGFEIGLAAAVFLFLPTLVIVPHGIAPLASIAGLFAAGIVACRGAGALRRLKFFAIVLGALVLWGLASAAWSVDPRHSMVEAGRLAGLFLAGLMLVAACPVLAAPRRLMAVFGIGLALALVVAEVQMASDGWLSRPFFQRGFWPPQLNQLSITLAVLALPLGAALAARRRIVLGLAVPLVLAAAIFSLVGTGAKATIVLGLVFAGIIYRAPARVARAMALISAFVIVTAPLTFARLASVPAVIAAAERLKTSAWHRLLIWSFAGDRIAERPFYGWGLDASRAIPGGQQFLHPGETWLPVHPHNAAIQLWVELGVPGAVLFVLIVALLWLALARAPWPRLYAAASGASLFSAFVATLGTYGMWEEWWIGTLWLVLFLILVMGRLVGSPGEEGR